MNSRNQSYVVYVLLFIAIIAMVVYSFSQNTAASGVLTINQLASEVQSGKVPVS